MKKTLLTLVIAFAIGIATLNAQNLQWAKSMGGALDDKGASIAIDASGNVYTTGTFSGTCDFDPGAGIFNLTPAGGIDIFVSKLDASGNFVWAKSIGGSGNDFGNSIALDASGNVYTTGYFAGTVDFDPGVGTANLTSAGAADVFISKLDASGNFVWAKRMGNTIGTLGYSITIDASGNVCTTGIFQGSVDFDPGVGTSFIASSGGRDIFISKLDASGNFVWAKKLGGTAQDFGLAITTDASGNVYTTGYFFGTADFDPGVGTANLTSAGSDDIFVSKLDASGNFVWAKRMGSSLQDYGKSIAVDASGNVYTTGYFNGTADFDPGVGTANLTSAGTVDIFISKLDASGNFVWANSMGSGGDDVGNSISIDTSGNVYTTGYYNGTVDFDPGVGITNLISVGFNDIFVSKFDASGNFLWANSAGGASTDDSKSLALTASGGIYTTGIFYATADFDPSPDTVNLVSAGGAEIFIQKLQNCPILTSSLSSQTNVSCNGASNGSASVSAIGGNSFTYSWAPSGGTAATATGLSAGTYTCTITNDCGNSTTQTVIIAEPTLLSASSSASSILCNGGTATVTVNATDGTPSYSGIGTFTVTAGTYSYTVTDVNGCTSSTSITVTEPTALSASSSASNILCNGGTEIVTVGATGGTPSYSGTGTFTVTAGTYSYTVTDTNGCTSNTTITVTESAAIVESQTLTICFGDSVVVGSNTYSSTGIYTDVLTAANGCDSTVTTDLTANAAIDVSTTLSSVTITANQSGATYQWIDCNNANLPIGGETNQSYTATANGDYAVIVTIGSCSDTSACVNILSTGTGESNVSSMINIYPNPNSGQCTIELQENATVTITDALGRIILSEQLNRGKNNINLIDQANGVYFIKTITNKRQTVSKIILDK